MKRGKSLKRLGNTIVNKVGGDKKTKDDSHTASSTSSTSSATKGEGKGEGEGDKLNKSNTTPKKGGLFGAKQPKSPRDEKDGKAGKEGKDSKDTPDLHKSKSSKDVTAGPKAGAGKPAATPTPEKDEPAGGKSVSDLIKGGYVIFVLFLYSS